ncbi:unnamed protein product [Caenorhabditis auriculariae]|uniref:Guanine nucleotide-binding protein subunit gamma n=1 Tax=Caenorhabditis auriculariae TaxID=2777116 RepID=A0A8S1H9T5_9PELO|nr:unnamed protein product [Caenorhabditis auriculariae]
MNRPRNVPPAVVGTAYNDYLQPEVPTEMERVQAAVDQLRVESKLKREKVSTVSKDLIKFCEEHKKEDVMLNGALNEQNNPYQDKKNCTIV